MLGEIAALLAALCGTVSAALLRIGIKGANPFHANIVRIWFGTTVILLTLPIIGGVSAYGSMPVQVIILLGFSGVIGLGVGDIFYLLGIKSLGIARSVPIACTYPLFTTAFALLVLREEVTFIITIGTVLIILGLWLLTSKSAGMKTGYAWRGVAASLIAASLWATSITLMTMALRVVDLLPAIAMRLTVACIIFTSILPITGGTRGLRRLTRLTWAVMAAAGIVTLIIGMTLLGYSLISIGAARAVPLSSLAPLFSVAIGILLFKESVSRKTVLGALISVLGTILVSLD